jgi:hypothetical protein
LIDPALLEELECELSDLPMHRCAINGLTIAAYIHNCFPVGIAFSQKGVVSYFSRKSRQCRSLDEFRISLCVGGEGSYFISLPDDDEDRYLYLTQPCLSESTTQRRSDGENALDPVIPVRIAGMA